MTIWWRSRVGEHSKNFCSSQLRHAISFTSATCIIIYLITISLHRKHLFGNEFLFSSSNNGTTSKLQIFQFSTLCLRWVSLQLAATFSQAPSHISIFSVNITECRDRFVYVGRCSILPLIITVDLVVDQIIIITAVERGGDQLMIIILMINTSTIKCGFG